MGGTRNPLIHSPANLLDVCGSGNTSGCHGYVESNRVQAVACGWLLPAGGDPLSVPVLTGGRWVHLSETGTYLEVS